MDDLEPRKRTRSDSDFEHEVMARCVEAWNSGGPAAVETLLGQHPELAPRLRERLAKLERAGLLSPAEEAEPAIPERLGEFAIKKRLGGGGMGVVFLAEQESLGRPVALKLMRPEQRYHQGARARFRREIEAIARLGDPGIVPIYSVGEDQGVEYFAMEYVRGASLGDVLVAVHATPLASLSGRDIAVVAAAQGELPLPAPLPEVFTGTWVQACCRIVARMARAAQHAHERGVVHRDLKPNNAMVTPDGRVMLLDFGLAAAAGAARITRTGAVLGTLHYMAPEQLRDGETDHRTDVYALGVTLHELLALRSPFRAESSEALRQQILHGEIAPLRERNPEVPREVQTIVAVAMDRDPARRYASAAALADDLELFLQHRPIRARPIGVGLRLVRWGQRHPALATAGVLTLAGLLALPFVMKLSRGYADRQVAVARQNAHSNLQSAIAAIDGILKSSRSPLLTRTPGLDAERRRQVEEAVALMNRLLRDNGDDRTVQSLYVRGMCRVADLQQTLGDSQRALASHERAADVLKALQASEGATHDLAALRAAFLVSRGSALVLVGNVKEAVRGWQEVIATCSDWPPQQLTREVRLALATCHNNLGKVAFGEGDAQGAIDHLERCVALESELTTESRPVLEDLDRVRTQINLGAAWRGKGDLAAAQVRYEGARARLQALIASTPDEPELRRETARVSAALASLASDRKDFTTSGSLREAALATMRQLVGDYPERVQYRQELGQMNLDLSNDRFAAKDLPGAEAAARTAVATLEDLCRKAPENLEYVALHSTMLQQLGTVLQTRKQESEAKTVLEHAVRLQESVVAKLPDDPFHRIVAAGLHQNLGLSHWNAEAWTEARAEWRLAAAHYEAAIARGSALPREPRRFPKLLSVLAQAELMCDDFEGIVTVLGRLQQVAPLPVETLRDVGAKLHVADRADFQALVAATIAAATRPGPASAADSRPASQRAR